MTRVATIITVFVALVGLGGFWIIKSNLVYHPEAIPRGLPRDITQEELREVFEEVQEEARPSARENSRADVGETEYHFGTKSTHKPMQHTFVVRNTGTDPLLLGEPNSSSCDVELSQRDVPPGGEATVTITWITGGRTNVFHAKAEIPTSDPTNEVLQFHIRGEVYQWVARKPDDIVIPATTPGQKPQVRSGYVFSKYWDSFEIGEIHSNRGVECEIFPATAEELAENEARSGYRIDVQVPYDLEDGNEYGARLDVPIIPPADHSEERMVVHFDVFWKIYRRFCLYSDDFSARRVVDLGVVKPGTSKRAVIRVKVHDENPSLEDAVLEVEPSFLNVKMIPQNTAKSQGNYVITVEVPEDAPTCSHLRPDLVGELRLVTNHPRISDETLKLRFAVVGEDRTSTLP